MAALTRHAFLSGALARYSPILSRPTNLLVVPARGTKVKKPPQKPKKKATLNAFFTSIESKGFLRPYKPYNPAKDVSQRLDSVCQSVGVSSNDKTRIDDLLVRFKLFAKCVEEFEYGIPNSKLVTIQTIGDLREFYQTPVITTTPYEALQNIELPPNLYIQPEAHRFHPDTDKMFNGKTAFPQSATLVTGLKYKDKYPGHRPEKPWPIKVHSVFDN
ncbi:hypothetical protein TSAR_012336 [Trichomalopsis sarcophagae]|uniref:Large ribosomal subunit protein mL50 n=1 Tax=Trichomalopsis sarcophagae TaxID=543379 RepID=A0A232FG67_9HYME|nr:hypothetical protein TSAR_012336 [Trichomalopsis sarcophagae]